MDMARPEIAFRIERQDSFCERSAVENAGPEPCILFASDNLPIERLVDDEVDRFIDWQTGCADMFAARARQQNKAFVAKVLNGQLAPEIDAICERTVADRRELLVNFREAAGSARKAIRRISAGS